MSKAGFARILGHEKPKEFFRGILARQRLANGFLFHGDAGRGKALFAEDLVGLIFCEHGEDCGTCRPCQRFRAGNHPDYSRVSRDAAKTRIAIEQLRQLRQWFSLAPFEAERRIALIDDAHEMSEEAQNSLLKLLEEPPALGLLLLVTSQPDSLLETIHSRLQRVYFGPLEHDQCLSILQQQEPVQGADWEQVLALTPGSPGRALDLAESGLEVNEIIARAQALFDFEVGPFAYGERLCGSRGSRAELYESAQIVLNTALEMIRLSLRNSMELPSKQAVDPRLILNWPQEILEDCGREIIACLATLAGNAAPRGAIESLKILIQRGLAKASRVR